MDELACLYPNLILLLYQASKKLKKNLKHFSTLLLPYVTIRLSQTSEISSNRSRNSEEI